MKLKDTAILISPKLKIRKLRTLITVITASALFGIIITALFTMCGFYDGLANSASTNLGGPTLVLDYPTAPIDTEKTRTRAVELYNKSTDPNKAYPVVTPDPIVELDGSVTNNPPYLIDGNPFAEAAAAPVVEQYEQDATDKITDIASNYNGKVVSMLRSYYSKGAVEPAGGESQGISSTGYQYVKDVDRDALMSLVKLQEQKDDVIQILSNIETAAKLLDVSRPRWSTSNPTSTLENFVKTVNEKAIGHQFTETYTTESGEIIKATYEIVGILPPSRTYEAPLSTIKPSDSYLFSLEQIVLNLQRSGDIFGSSPYYVINPDSTAFQSAYRRLLLSRANPNIAVSFGNIQDATDFMTAIQGTCLDIEGDNYDNCREIYISELASNQIKIQSDSNFTDTAINVFTIIFTIVATIIMIGTVSRVVSDERQTIALYRSVGASTKSILQVFSAYILTLCLLIIACATIIGLILSGVITAMNTATITANVAAMHNVLDPSPIIFIGFDPRIILIYLTIIAIGILCLVVVMGRLTSKNIVKDLRKA